MKKLILCWFIFLINDLAIANSPVIVENLLDAIALSESSDNDILVIFTADWCKYCQVMKKDLDDLNKEPELDNIIICYVNIDANSELKQEYKVSTIPDYMILRNKIEIKRARGYNGKSRFLQWLKKHDR